MVIVIESQETGREGPPHALPGPQVFIIRSKASKSGERPSQTPVDSPLWQTFPGPDQGLKPQRYRQSGRYHCTCARRPGGGLDGDWTRGGVSKLLRQRGGDRGLGLRPGGVTQYNNT